MIEATRPLPSAANLSSNFASVFQRCAAGYRGRQEGVQINFIRAALGCQFNHRHDVVFVAVDAARRHQAHDMHGFARGDGFIDRAGQYRVGEEGAFFDFNVRAGQILGTRCGPRRG